MPLTQLAKSQWQAYFDRVSKTLGAKRVEIEVTGLALGHQVEAEWIPLLGLSYDPKDDVLVVTGEGLRHLISHPSQVHVDRELDSVHGIEVIDAEGNHHIVLLKDSLSLPAA
jgi:hypothetical protein